MGASLISPTEALRSIPGREGVSERRPAHDPNVLKVEEWTFEPGVEFEGHAHSEAQVTYVAEGALRLRQGDEVKTLRAGSYYYTPGGSEHNIEEILERTTVVIVSRPN